MDAYSMDENTRLMVVRSQGAGEPTPAPWQTEDTVVDEEDTPHIADFHEPRSHDEVPSGV